MQEKQKRGLVWFRNNLRVLDNESLTEAVRQNDSVLGVFCFDPSLFESTSLGFKRTGPFRTQFLLESVSELRSQLKEHGIPLLISLESPAETLPRLCRDHKFEAIYTQKEWTRDEVGLNEAIKKHLPANVVVKESYSQFLFHPDDVPFDPHQIPEVFTAFRKKCEASVQVRERIPIPKVRFKWDVDLALGDLPRLKDLGVEDFETDPRSAFPFKGGEKQGMDRLEDYFFGTKKLGYYKKTRNGLLGVDYSSKFSPWLANGSISPRTIYAKVREFEREHFSNQSTYWLIFELIWRDFFKYISLKHGNRIFHLGGIKQREYQWSTDQSIFQNWIDGQTKDDFVNANMLEIKRTGWMSNRGRQNVASYLSRDLNIDWRWGALYFESMLLDYDVHSNYGNWMYVAGVGNDPRDRKFNTQLQAERYDPRGKFRKRWLQESLFS